jgi:aspartyl-tRNA(Asn)/glutamyl-tRNA(Gln) amidotransferase subunit B
VGESEFGNKVELKNINSFRAVFQAIEYEVERQGELLDAGERVEHETRGWREEESRTVSQRSKEFAQDYRYFPEPDLPSLTFSKAYVEELRARLPELPDGKRQRLMEQYGLSAYEANLLSATRARADYYEGAVAEAGDDELRRRRAKAVANWMLGDLARLLNASGIEITEAKVTPKELHALIALIEEGTISNTGAKTVFEEMFRSGKPPQAIVEEQGLAQISAADELTGVIEQVIAQNPKPVADFLGGKDEALKFLMGQVMRETRGRAKPDLVQQLLREQLRSVQ